VSVAGYSRAFYIEQMAKASENNDSGETEKKVFNQDEKEKLIKELEEWCSFFYYSRAFIQALDKNIEQQQITHSAVYHSIIRDRFPQITNLPMTTLWKAPLRSEHIDLHKEAIQWQNQNFIVRLMAFLEERRVVVNEADICKLREGSRTVLMFRNLRNVFAHNMGKYSPEGKLRNGTAHNEIMDFIGERCGFEPKQITEFKSQKVFPLHIDKVMDVFVADCKAYIEALPEE